MARYLVVANLTVVSDELYELIRDRVRQGLTQLHVLVPAARDPSSWRGHVDDEAAAAARERLAAALKRFEELGLEVQGEVGDASPVQAVGDVLRRGETFDEVILSTLRPGPSKWLRMDVAARIERTTGLPLTHVTARR